MQYRFDQIAFNSTAKKKPTDDDKEHYIGLEHLDSDCLSITRWGSDVAPTGEKLLMKKGDILFGKRRAYQRKVGIAPFDGIFSAHGMVLRPNEEVINKDFFPFFISSDQFMERAVRISVGGLSPTINWKDLREQEFELPSLDKQLVLADKLWAAYRLKESYKKLLVATDEMVKSQFIEMFYNDNFTCEKLKAHIEVIRGVSYKPTDVRDAKDKDSSVILRSNNIFNGLINYDDIVFVDSTRVSEAQELSKGDIVMCGSNGSKNLVGKAAMITEPPLHKTSFGAFCLGIRCKDTIHPMYLSSYFQTSIYRNKIEELGAGSNILNIKPDYINNMEIPVPRIEQQLKFVSIAEQADKSKFVGFKSQFIEMFGERTTTPVGYYIKDSFPGDWGKEGLDDTGVKVIRTTNFTNFGKLNLSEVVTRSIEEHKIQKKQILKYDTILERSGGTADNPVGRVVLFEEDEQYLCNNFTQVLRFKDIDPRFAFYALFYFYQMNKTSIRSMGSKTTGIQNLNMSKYLEIGIPNADEDEQKQFVSIAEQADKSKLLHRKSIKYSKYSL